MQNMIMKYSSISTYLFLRYILFFIASIFFSACKRSPIEETKDKITSYISSKVKNPKTYIPITFSSLDTLTDFTLDDTLFQTKMKKEKHNYRYRIWHVYEIENSEKEKVKMNAYFHFDSTFKITSTSPISLNGDYGHLTGNVFWKYNNYLGNKPDAGSSITLYALDTLRKEIKYEATSDVMGNFKFEKVLPGNYLLIVKSYNTRNSPNNHLDELLINGYNLSDIFGYNIHKSNIVQLKEYKKLDSLYKYTLLSNDNEYGGFTKRYETYRKFEKQKMELADKIIEKFPYDFKTKLGLYTSYSNKLKISSIKIDEGKFTNEVIDFGITYF
jgi:hypothetical protein